MKRFLLYTAILVLPALLFYLMFEFFDMGYESNRGFVSVFAGLSLSANYLLRLPSNKHNSAQTEEAKNSSPSHS